MAFLAAAVAMALVYAVWTFWVPLLPSNLYVPLLDLGKITGYTWTSAALYLSIVVLLYVLYVFGYRAIRHSSIKTWWIFAAAGVFAVELMLAYPATAVDIFGYIAHGRLLALHHVNPLIVTPNTFAGDPILAYLAFPDEPSQYGPLWVLLNGGVALLAQSDLLVEVLLYKLVAALAHLGGAGLIYAIARRLTGDTLKAKLGAYLYACNPLLLWEMVGNAHNDGLMMLFGLLAVWLLVADYNVLVLAALAAGALVKVPVALLAPALFFGTWRRSRARAIEGAALALVLAAAVYRPFWDGPRTLTALRRTDLFTASLGSVVRLALQPYFGLGDASSYARTLSLSAFAGIAAICLVLALKAETDVDLLRSGYYLLVAALLLLTTWFQAWYVVWPLAIGAALPEARRHQEVALLSLGGLLQYFVFIYLWVIGVFPPYENIGVQSAAYAAIIGPLLFGLIARLRPTRVREYSSVHV